MPGYISSLCQQTYWRHEREVDRVQQIWHSSHMSDHPPLSTEQAHDSVLDQGLHANLIQLPNTDDVAA
jgi:hypothetical protein